MGMPVPFSPYRAICKPPLEVVVADLVFYIFSAAAGPAARNAKSVQFFPAKIHIPRQIVAEAFVFGRKQIVVKHQ